MHSFEYGCASPPFNNVWTISVERKQNHDLLNNDLYNLPKIKFEQFRKIPRYALPFEWKTKADG
jgi:hypothetical protein